MNLEIELKFSVSPSDIIPLTQHPLLANQLLECVQITSQYYDTDEQLLRLAGFILRVSECNNQYTQTVKTITPSQQGLHQRKEWNHKLLKESLNISALKPIDELGYLLTDDALAELKAQFAIHVNRTNWLVSNSNAQILVSLDQGIAKTTNKQIAFNELEIELIQGEADYLHQFAEALLTVSPLTAINYSKADTGYGLLPTTHLATA